MIKQEKDEQEMNGSCNKVLKLCLSPTGWLSYFITFNPYQNRKGICFIFFSDFTALKGAESTISLSQ